jgi:hypothetical protein
VPVGGGGLCLAASPSCLPPEPPPDPDAATRFFPRRPQPAALGQPYAPAAAARTTLCDCTPTLASRLAGRNPAPVQATTLSPPPWLSRQTCWLYVNMCVIVKFEAYLTIKLLLYSWIWTHWHVYVKTLRVPCYPTGTLRVRVRILTCYVWRLRAPEIDGYANECVNALPSPYLAPLPSLVKREDNLKKWIKREDKKRTHHYIIEIMGPRPSLNGQRKNPYLNFKGPPIHVNGLNPSSIIVLADSGHIVVCHSITHDEIDDGDNGEMDSTFDHSIMISYLM